MSLNKKLTTGEQFAHSLLHMKKAYDPVERHDRYERNKQLKGRKQATNTNLTDLQYNTEQGIKKIGQENDPKQKALKLESRMDQAGALRKELRGTGQFSPAMKKFLEGTGKTRDEAEKLLLIAQYETTAEYFNIKLTETNRNNVTKSVDRYGNDVYLPPGVTQLMFQKFLMTAKNDPIPNIDFKNPIKKFDLKKHIVELQNPLHKGKDPSIKYGVSPNGKPVKKAPVGYKAPVPENTDSGKKNVTKQVEDRRKKK